MARSGAASFRLGLRSRRDLGIKQTSRPTIPGRTEDHLPLLPSGPGGVRQPHVARGFWAGSSLQHRRLEPPLLMRGGSCCCWRRGWDLNPRYRSRYTRFPVVLLKPLEHLSNPWWGPPPLTDPSMISTGAEGLRHPHTPRLASGAASSGCPFARVADCKRSGERGIRTPGTVTGTPDFESGAFDQARPALRRRI